MKRALTISLALLLVALMAASVAGAREAERRVPMPYESNRQSVLLGATDDSTQLPGGIDRMDVVRRVWKNREEAAPRIGAQTPPERIDEPNLWSPIENSWLPAGQDFYSDVAYDGKNYFVVWENEGFGYGHSSDVYGTRVDASGEVLDPCGIAISARGDDERLPRVTFNGSNYLVVWMDGRNADWDIYGARVNVSGEVLDPDGIAMSTVTGLQTSPDVASDGGNYLIIWRDWRNGSPTHIYGARVNAAGAVLDPNGIPIATGALDQYSPAVSFGGTDYLVVWVEYRGGTSRHDIYGARLDTSGLVLDPGSILISGSTASQSWPAIAFNGTIYLVVWIDERNFIVSSSDIFGTRVSTSGIVLDPNGIPISTKASLQMDPAVASDGTNFLVTWTDTDGGSGSDIYGARVNSSGIVLVPYNMGISKAYSNQTYSAVVFGAANYLCTWTDFRSGSEYDIYGTRIDAIGSVLDADGIEISGPSLLIPAIVDLVPGTLNLKSQGRWVTCYIELPVAPEVYSVADINIASVRLNGSVKAEESKWEIGNYDGDQYLDLMVKFDKMEVGRALSPGHHVAVTITGYLACLPFSGTDYVDVINPPISPPEDQLPAISMETVSFAVSPTASHSYRSISFSMINPGRVILRVYNIAGQHIRTLVDAYRQPGLYSEVWDGRAIDGRELPTGIYFCRLEIGDFVATRKMVLLR